MKKYALTGHTQGIGARLYEILSPNCIAFSKSTGFDITNSKDRKKIIDMASDCDIFINNAADGMGQNYLFLELFRAWQHQNKTIINVGSRISEIVLPNDRTNLLEYQSEKIVLKQMSELVQKIEGTLCKVEYKWFAYVGTEKILKKYPHFTTKDYISIDEACNIILS